MSAGGEAEAGPSVGSAPEAAAAPGSRAGEKGAAPLVDAHFHLGFLSDPRAFAQRARAAGIRMAAVSVESAEHEALVRSGAPALVGLGLHPWLVDEGSESRAAQERFLDRVGSARLIGEVGLDFAPAFVGSAAAQERFLEEAMRACARAGGKVLSVHAVRSTGAVLDLACRTRLLDTCALVLHWFSGSSDELVRARSLGCSFSVGSRMLASRRGRAYARQIPEGALLLESDLPQPAGPLRIGGHPGAGEGFSLAAHLSDLEGAARTLSELRDQDARALCARNAGRLGLIGE